MLSRQALWACLFLIPTHTTWAQPIASSLELDWHAPRTCPQVANVHADVMRLVGTTVASGPHLLARGTVLGEAADRWTLTLRTVVEGVTGERVLVGQSCHAVTDAAVITLALTLNPDLTLPLPAAATPPVSVVDPNRPGPGPATLSIPELPRPGPSDDGAVVHWLAGTLVGPRWGLFARPVEEYGLGIGANQGRMHAWIEGGFASGTVSSAKPGAYADFWFISLRGLGCYSIGGRSLDLLPCSGLDWTRAQGQSAGFDNTGGGSMSWYSLAIGAKLSWRFHRLWRVQLDSLGLIPLARPKAYVSHSGDEDLLRPSSLGSRVTLGLQWQFL